ncbi:uncharacterized protein BO88DRAFT_251083 [Aspergillus vadensis CBS 113365]|uniref:Uncharacterized protein n=1 Tax=Aspergillus vadensis (strain CBS 113365 / IMI 142717 / IBT 24658) TaxID=1448311 RepID=A0A319BEN1_ASPVC|nr:hypothetical protein BO88DRAFT_251083 [Aspergillus vadensis CBS 113365]PYH70579.1 hypothetical protein BO88DRAFT_251083 [Aspergillus vadensis CBS 113365]
MKDGCDNLLDESKIAVLVTGSTVPSGGDSEPPSAGQSESTIMPAISFVQLLIVHGWFFISLVKPFATVFVLVTCLR